MFFENPLMNQSFVCKSIIEGQYSVEEISKNGSLFQFPQNEWQKSEYFVRIAYKSISIINDLHCT